MTEPKGRKATLNGLDVVVTPLPQDSFPGISGIYLPHQVDENGQPTMETMLQSILGEDPEASGYGIVDRDGTIYRLGQNIGTVKDFQFEDAAVAA